MAIKGNFRTIVVLYVAALALSLFFAYPPPQEVPPEGESPATAGVFFGYVLVATAVFLIIIKIWPWIFRYIIYFLELFFLFATTAIITVSYALPTTLPFLAVLIRIIWWRSTVIQNISTIIIISVSTAVVGASLAPTVAAILLAILATYDYISVFVTKHMVTLAKALGARERLKGEKKEIHMLGAGDIAIPGIFAVSLLRISIPASVAAAIGATIGLVWTTKWAKRWKRVLPALPSIALPELLLAVITLTLSSSL